MNLTHAVVLRVVLIIAAGTLLGLCFAGQTAHGADCSVLHDADERHMCRALTGCLKSECEFISKPDVRQVCRIRVEEGCHK